MPRLVHRQQDIVHEGCAYLANTIIVPEQKPAPDRQQCQRDAGPGEVGSMMIKGPTATLYWKPYIQDNKLLITMKKGIKAGWNMMGDAVMMDKDGFIFFQAREDDMIKSSGFRLAPTEIEDTIIGLLDEDRSDVSAVSASVGSRYFNIAPPNGRVAGCRS